MGHLKWVLPTRIILTLLMPCNSFLDRLASPTRFFLSRSKILTACSTTIRISRERSGGLFPNTKRLRPPEADPPPAESRLPRLRKNHPCHQRKRRNWVRN